MVNTAFYRERQADPSSKPPHKLVHKQSGSEENTTQPLGFEALSMVMLDLDYNGTIFKMDEVFYAKELEAHGWTAAFDPERLGSSMMVVFLVIYGNEAREVIAPNLRLKMSPSP